MSYELVQHKHNRNLRLKINDIFDLYYEKIFHLNPSDIVKAGRMEKVKTGKNLFNVTYNESA